MEATSNFAHALEHVYNQRKAAGIAVAGDVAVSQLIRHPITTDVNGGLVNHMAIAHRRVRRYYIRKTWDFKALFTDIDWNSILDWLTEHWDDILRVILLILPMII